LVQPHQPPAEVFAAPEASNRARAALDAIENVLAIASVRNTVMGIHRRGCLITSMQSDWLGNQRQLYEKRNSITYRE
jgi:hypothetical protein